MPAPIDEVVKRRVVQQWLAGESREEITADNNIAAGTVSIIVDEYKLGLDNSGCRFFRNTKCNGKRNTMASWL
jgi:hypothetical protein